MAVVGIAADAARAHIDSARLTHSRTFAARNRSLGDADSMAAIDEEYASVVALATGC